MILLKDWKNVSMMSIRGGTPTALAIKEAAKLINRCDTVKFADSKIIDVEGYDLLC